MSGRSLGAREAVRLAELILAAIRREYPTHVSHYAESDADFRPPRELTPAFFGSFDWHSAVHGHWALVRLLGLHPSFDAASRTRAALDASFAPERLAGELRYLGHPARTAFERPYGLAWLLQLCAELRDSPLPAAARWRDALAPLETLARDRLLAWLPRLHWPIRSGAHNQTAFALGLAWDWAGIAGDEALAAAIREQTLDWHLADVSAPIAYEPSAHDFLSPALAEADLMRRVLDGQTFANWLDRFLPDLEGAAGRAWLTPVASPDPADGHLAHLDGLNLSRAWMLDGIAAALPATAPLRPVLAAAADAHATAGMAAVTGEHYAGAHWLGSYAVYLLSRRGTGPS